MLQIIRFFTMQAVTEFNSYTHFMMDKQAHKGTDDVDITIDPVIIINEFAAASVENPENFMSTLF
jgi:hypothetical protein